MALRMHVIVHYHVPYPHYYQWFSVCGQLDNELCVVRSLSKFIGGILRFMIDFIVLTQEKKVCLQPL